MGKQKKEKRLTFRVTPEQYERIVAEAERADMTPAAYTRAAVLHQRIVLVPGLDDVYHQMSKIGTNLNQLAKLANVGAIQVVYLDETENALRELYAPIFGLIEATAR